MKVLQIIDSLNIGGAEKLLLDTIPIYVEKGIEMDIVLLHDRNYPFTQALEKENCCKIYRLGGGSVYNPLHIFKITKIINNYDISHVHLFPAQYWTVLANIVKGNKTKLVFTEHSTSNRRIRNKIFNPFEKFIYHKYDKVICITEQVQQIIHQHVNMDYKNLPIIKNGVNISKIKVAKPLNKSKISDRLQPEDKIIIQVSSMHDPKDQATLIESLHHLPNNFKLILLGDGILREELEIFTKKENLESRVFFLGRKTNVYEYLKASDFIVLSSRYEGLSLSSIEGMASGKPFIASDVPGLKEIVNGYGVLFPQGDKKTLANKILELNNNPKLYNETVKKCQERAEQFDIHTTVEKHIELYNTLYENK